MKYLAAICHDIKSNTLEATWLNEVTDETGNIELKRVRCHNYSPSQKVMFLAEVENGEKWTTAAGWTDEYCAAYTAAEIANTQG
jgi:hypothetical protein